MYTLSEKSKVHREGIDPKLIEIDDLAIRITLIDYGHGKDAGLRTAERQNELHIAVPSRSKADGFLIRSKHQAAPDGYGKALDFYAYVDGKASWEPEHLAMVAAAQLQAASTLGYKVRWGGLWKSKSHAFYGWDMPHIQLLE